MDVVDLDAVDVGALGVPLSAILTHLRLRLGTQEGLREAAAWLKRDATAWLAVSAVVDALDDLTVTNFPPEMTQQAWGLNGP